MLLVLACLFICWVFAVLIFFEFWNHFFFLRTSLLCIVGVLAGEEFLTLAVGVSVM